MRLPRASAVIVALSTFVAVVTIAALASQLSPLDRAGAVLPDGAITIESPETEPSDDVSDETPGADETPATTGPAPGGTASGGTGGGSSADDAAVVAPAPAQTIEPEPEPEPTGPPVNPGNGGNPPGLSNAPADNPQGKP